MVMVMVRNLYGLKSSESAWRTIFVETLRDMYFVPKVTDPDVYRRRARKNNGEDDYELLFIYVYDFLCFSKNPHLTMDALDFTYDPNSGSVGPLKIYLGDEINKYQVTSGKSHWIMSST